MVVLSIRNVEINFPFQPYPCQVEYMGKVIQCLQEGTNGVLESPTGTGKTLCLLCATLAWRETYLAHLQLNIKIQENKASGGFCEVLQEGLGQAAVGWTSENTLGPKYDVPKIIYTSRTHSQLSQAVNELKNTIYKPKVCVLGSREQMCIHPGVLKLDSNTAKVHACRSKVGSRSCHYYNNLEANHSEKEFSENILDIEDLVQLGNKRNVCPYYFSRNQKSSADIVFMPYNYLIDAKSRSANNVDISNSIILFDEAHNLEKICEEAVSFDLSSFDIASCVEELDQCLDIVANKEEDGTMSLTDDSAEGGDLEKKEVAYMKGLLLMLEEELHKISSSSPSQGVTKPGSYIFELLKNVKITLETQDQVVELLEKCNKFLATNSSGLKGKQFALAKFSDALKVVFKTGSSSFSGLNETSVDYKVHIEKQDNSNSMKKQLDAWSSSKAAKSNEGFTLGYWCFSPGVTMKDLIKSEIRSIILTSGTLSPLPSFKAELQIDIPVQLQNPHVIEEHQMCVGILRTGPDGVSLNSSYQNRSNPKYLTSLGNTLVNFARIVPDGLLVFFPSYGVLNMSVKHWQSNGAYGRINQMKQIFVEPRTKAEFTEAMEGFYERIRDPNTKGAAFFAVCRGKVSEGLDFADTNGRAVVITGMPYPPRHDARVILKMNFLDEMKNKRTFKGLTGKDWYQQQASRAVNQAVGRVLRHKGDYGAIILCDERFVYANNLAELPLWVRPYIKKYNNFGEIQRHLTQFFRRAVQLCDKSCIKQNFQPIETPSNTTELSVPSVPVKHLKKALSAFEKIPMSTERDLTSRDISKETPLTVHNYSNTVTSCTDSRLAKPKGCLEYLDAYENEKKCNSEQELGSCSNCSTSPVEETTHARTAVKKKLKIVRSKHQHEEKESERFDKVANARRYIQKIKTTLGKEKLVVFSNTLKEYKQNNDINSLLRSLTPLLLNEKKNYEMFLGFSSYIESTEQREIFFKKYTDITGEEIPGEFEKRKRQTKPDTTTSSKKARIECL